MVNPESIKKAEEKRNARRAARAGNEEAAVAQTDALSKLSQLQKAAKTDPKAAAELQAAAPAKPAVKPLTKKQKQLEARKAAEKQADADARVKATVDEDKMSLAYYRERGVEPPLHVLNYHANKADAAIRDDARDLARAVGQVAYEQALDRDHRNRHARERRMNKAVIEQARIKQAQEAAKA